MLVLHISAKSIICGMMAAELISAKSIIPGIRTVLNSFARNIMYGTKDLVAVIDNRIEKQI